MFATGQSAATHPMLAGLLLGLSAMAVTYIAQAATVPDIAREIRLGDERERALRAGQEKAPDVRLQERPAKDAGRIPADETPCIVIQSIALQGELADRFQWALSAIDPADDPASGRCLGGKGIRMVIDRIQNAIVARGFITTRVLAAPQDLRGGTLTLTLIPGRVRSVRRAEGTGTRATLANALPVETGDLLNLRDIEQGLENLKRVPTAEADIQIVPAEGLDAEPGQSDLVVKWKQGFPFRVSLSADDSGNKATSKYQGGVTVSYDHWWTLNDLFYISLNHDLGGGDPGVRGTRGYIVHYSVPFGYWLLGFTASQNRYHQSVPGASQTFLYSGKSENSEIKLSRLIYRDAVRKTTLSLKGWTRNSRNFIDDTEIEVQRRRMAGWGLGVSQREFIGAATLDANLDYRRGTGAFDSRPAPEEAFNEGTSRPAIITADVQLQSPFSAGEQRLRYGGVWRAQWNRTPLVPQDRFSIGGRYTVRGFDGESQLLSGRGWLIRNDLGWALGQTGQEFYVGMDYGAVGGSGSASLIGKHLSGAVLGLRGGGKGFSFDIFAGGPISKPEGFQTPGAVAGFNINWSFQEEQP